MTYYVPENEQSATIGLLLNHKKMLAADELSPSPPTYASKCMKTTILSFFWQNDFNMSVTQVYLGMINYAQCAMVGSSVYLNHEFITSLSPASQ